MKQSNPYVVDICLGTDQQLFRFSPNRVHDVYADFDTLIIELIIDDSFLIDYKFKYLEPAELMADLRKIRDLITPYK